MADKKKQLFTVKQDDIRADKRLTEIFLRMGVVSSDEVKTRLSTLKDSEENVISVSIEDIIKAH